MLIEFINQTTENNCGVAVLAMITRISLAEGDAFFERKGIIPPISVYEMRRALQEITGESWREIHTQGTLSECSPLFTPLRALAALVRKKPPYHWVAINHGRVYDPEAIGPEVLALSPIRSYSTKRLIHAHPWNQVQYGADAHQPDGPVRGSEQRPHCLHCQNQPFSSWPLSPLGNLRVKKTKASFP